jgi:hypothetical protein
MYFVIVINLIETFILLTYGPTVVHETAIMINVRAIRSRDEHHNVACYVKIFCFLKEA